MSSRSSRLLAELADREQRAAERERRDDRVDAAAVGEPRVDHRRRLVDAAADLGDDLVDDPAQVRVVVEAHVRLVQAALALDPDVVRAVDHDLGDAVVGQQPLERPVAEDVVGDLGGEPLAVVARRCRAPAARCCGCRRAPARAAPPGRSSDVEELRAELADHREVDAVLELGERDRAGRSARRPCCGEALVEIHRTPSSRSRRFAPAGASAGCRRGRPRRRARRMCVRERAGTPRAASESARCRARSASPSLTERGISRSLGTRTSGSRPRIASTSSRVMPTRLSARFRTSVMRSRLVAHQLERLEAELRVLQRERVEHPDHADVRRAVDRRDHLGREARAACRR